MRGLAYKDVEHEALTAKEQGSELPELFSRQMDESHQSPFSCRCFSTMHKMRASIVFVLILLILVIFMAIALSVFLSNINNGADFDSEKTTRSGGVKQYNNRDMMRRANGDTKDCVLVNHINDNPGYYMCDCVVLSDTCLSARDCVREDKCPSLDRQAIISTNDISCMVHADCNGILPFCYNGLCSPCSDCHYCSDGIDSTCGTCGTGYPTMEEDSCSLPEQDCIDRNGNACDRCLGRKGICKRRPYEKCKVREVHGAKWCGGKVEVDLTIVITDHLSDNNTILYTKLKNVIRETKKLIESDLEFERRFPRNGLRRRRTRPYRPKWIQNPLLFEILQNQEKSKTNKTLSTEKKVKLIMLGLDENEDNKAGPRELLNWIHWIEGIFQGHMLEQQWRNLGVELYSMDYNQTRIDDSANPKKVFNPSIGWPDYQSKILPDGPKNTNDTKRINKEWRRWQLADKNGDNRLTKYEFKSFLFPHLMGTAGGDNEVTEVIVSEALEALDLDSDGRISKEEFVHVHTQSNEDDEILHTDIGYIEQYFLKDLDVDGDKYLDVKELTKWVHPKNFQAGKSEVVHLMDVLDEDKNKDLDFSEIMKKPKIFLESQVSYNGQLYNNLDFQNKVFMQTGRSK